MRHHLITDLLYKDITIEYDNSWEDRIIEAHMDIALSSYDTGDHSAGYGSANLLSYIVENEEAKAHFRNIALLYLAGFCKDWERMFTR